MENKWIVASVIIALVVGFGLGALAYNDEDIVCDVCIDCPAPEVLTEIEYINNTKIVDMTDDLLDNSVELFLEDLEEEEEVWCKGDEYDIEEVEVRKIYDDFVISYDGEDKEIDFEVKLKFDDSDDKCYKKYNVNAFYEEGEDAEISY